MKTTFVILAAVLISGFAVAGDTYVSTVPASGQSVVIAPQRNLNPATTTEWAVSTAYRQGRHLKTQAGGFYMLVSTGTVTTGSAATAAPSHAEGDGTTSDGLVWRKTYSKFEPRASVNLTLQSGGPVWFKEGPGAVTNQGFGPLTTATSNIKYSGQSSISAASTAGAVISVGEANP